MRARTLILFFLTYAIEIGFLLFALLVIAPLYIPALQGDAAVRLAGVLAGFACFLVAMRVATSAGVHLWLGSPDWREHMGKKLVGARHSLARRIAVLALAGDAVVLAMTTQDFQTLYWPSLVGLIAMGVIYWVVATQILKARGKRLVSEAPLPG